MALQAVRDPGNLGTIIRTADAAGCGAVILVGDCCDPYSVEAVRATMGSIFAGRLLRASRSRDSWTGGGAGLARWSGPCSPRPPTSAPPSYAPPTLILMGNEQAGLPPELADACDTVVKIPMRGRADSLNLAVATGVMIYAAAV